MRLAFLLLAVFIPALGVSIAHAQEPEATSLPGPNDAAVVIYVINDLNSNGRQDPNEPGLEGWTVSVGCGDAFLRLGSTDPSGRLLVAASPGEPCFLLNVPRGWLVTGGNQRGVALSPGNTTGILFLAHHVGDNPQSYSGNAFVNGLPAPLGTTVDAIFNGNDCGEPQFGFASAVTWYSMYVVGAADRPGCPLPGEQFSLTVNDSVVATVTFSSEEFVALDLFLGPKPMYFSVFARQGEPVPYIGSIACGEARKWTGPLMPENYFMVYVLPDAAQIGCGASGRTVTVKAGGLIVLQVPWKEGLVLPDDLPPFTPIPDVTLPITGRTDRDDDGFSLALFVALAGLVFLTGGLLARRALLRE